MRYCASFSGFHGTERFRQQLSKTLIDGGVGRARNLGAVVDVTKAGQAGPVRRQWRRR
jgi:hypothetical protein